MSYAEYLEECHIKEFQERAKSEEEVNGRKGILDIDEDFVDLVVRMENNESLNNDELSYLLYKVIQSSLTNKDRYKMYLIKINNEKRKLSNIFKSEFGKFDCVVLSVYKDIFEKSILPSISLHDKDLGLLYRYINPESEYFRREVILYGATEYVSISNIIENDFYFKPISFKRYISKKRNH